jgi:hypothetical protein
MYRHPVTLFTGDADWHKLVTDLFYDFVSILLVWVAKLQNAIKLENISNLITSPSSYQCRKTTWARFVHFVILGRHTSMECMCAYWGSPKVNFQNRIIRIKHIFSGVYWCITWTKSLTNLHKIPKGVCIKFVSAPFTNAWTLEKKRFILIILKFNIVDSIILAYPWSKNRTN